MRILDAQRLGFALSLSACGSAHAGVIASAAFFDSIPHSIVDFETDGAGDPLMFFPGEQGRRMDDDEYVSQGVRFSEPSELVWIQAASVQDVLQSGGSPVTHLSNFSGPEWVIEFLVPVRAFGFFALSGRLATAPVPDPSGFRAYNAEGNLLGEALLEEPLLDGQIGLVEFGSMGFFSDTPIARVEIVRKTGFGIDNLTFSSVPAPGGFVALCLGLGVVAGRRR